MKQKREEMGESSSDEFESVANDSQCESYHSSDEEMADETTEQQQDTSKQSKQVDNDGFEQVQEKKRRR